MDQTLVKNPFDKITAEDVYQEALSQGYIQRIHKDLTKCIKNSNSYVALMKAAKDNVLRQHFALQPISDLESKKERIQEAAFLAREFDTKVIEIFDATLDIECKPIAEQIIKKLAHSKQENNTTILTPKKRKLDIPEDLIQKPEKSPWVSRSITDANDCESVSSVHTSELSSLSDDVEVDTGNSNKQQKKLSFKSVNEAYKSMVEEKKKSPIKPKTLRSSKAHVPSVSKSAVEKNGYKTLPKRNRKPNSRYNFE